MLIPSRPGDTARWTHHPLSGEVVSQRIIGRGASDMKGGLAAAVTALLNTVRGDVSCGLLLTADEEIGCAGARAAAGALSALPVGAVIIPESTANDVLLAHRGALWLRLTARGLAAHGGTPERGRNALPGTRRGASRHRPGCPAATTGNWEPARSTPARSTRARRSISSPTSPMPAWTSATSRPMNQMPFTRGWPPNILGSKSPCTAAPPVLSRADDPWIRTLPTVRDADPAAATYIHPHLRAAERAAWPP